MWRGIGVFLDHSTAFHCVDNGILLDCFTDWNPMAFRVPREWLGSYFSHRTQFVQMSRKSSKLVKLYRGVPQGSILSTAFVFYVNDIGSSLQRGRIAQFADDTALRFEKTSLFRIT